MNKSAGEEVESTTHVPDEQITFVRHQRARFRAFRRDISNDNSLASLVVLNSNNPSVVVLDSCEPNCWVFRVPSDPRWVVPYVGQRRADGQRSGFRVERERLDPGGIGRSQNPVRHGRHRPD